MPDDQAPRLLCVEVHDGRAAVVHDRDGRRAARGAAADQPTSCRSPPAPASSTAASTCRDRRRATRSAPTAATCWSTAAPTATGTPQVRRPARRRLRAAAPRCATTWPRRRPRLAAQGAGRRGPVRLPGRRTRARCPTAGSTELAAWAAERGWTVSLQGRKIYAVPEAADQERRPRRGRPAHRRRPGSWRPATPCSTPTCCSPPTAAGARATANSPTPAGPRRTSPRSPRRGVAAGETILRRMAGCLADPEH